MNFNNDNGRKFGDVDLFNYVMNKKGVFKMGCEPFEKKVSFDSDGENGTKFNEVKRSELNVIDDFPASKDDSSVRGKIKSSDCSGEDTVGHILDPV